mmetsp:Transcript_57679/g.185339  ORF Transcript_57679/g.185339 Transcript_57679/m.185339 type:complete len:204 (+) Transcript_57679:1485-2096(+)
MLSPHWIAQPGTSRSIIHAGTSQSSCAPTSPGLSADVWRRYLSIRSKRKDLPVRKAPITPTTATFCRPVRFSAISSCAISSSPRTTLFVSRSIFMICSGLPPACAAASPSRATSASGFVDAVAAAIAAAATTAVQRCSLSRRRPRRRRPKLLAAPNAAAPSSPGAVPATAVPAPAVATATHAAAVERGWAWPGAPGRPLGVPP